MNPKDLIIERLERSIELPSYLAQRGYQIALSQSGPDGIAMANPSTGDTVIVRRSSETDKWSYTNLRDPADRGSISDFALRRDHISLPQFVERLAALADPLSRTQEALRYKAVLSNPPHDLGFAIATHRKGVEQETQTIRALESLGIPKGTLDEWRFGPIRNAEAVSKVLSDPPALWISKFRPTDKSVVITEQPIDALAYERVRGRQTACYIATGRNLTPDVAKKLAHLLCEVPDGVKVVLAFGSDERGRHLAAQVRALAPALTMERREPEFGTRWSNRMRLEQNHARAMSRTAMAISR